MRVIPSQQESCLTQLQNKINNEDEDFHSIGKNSTIKHKRLLII